MPGCPICADQVENGEDPCGHCGYSFSSGLVADPARLRNLAAALQRAGNWQGLVELKLRVHEVYLANPSGSGWSLRKTGELLAEAHANVDKDLRVARALRHQPELELAKCPNKHTAFKRLQQADRRTADREPRVPYDYESELQEYIAKHADQVPQLKGWELANKRPGSLGKWDTGEVGVIDLLFEHGGGLRWLVWELKRDQTSDETVGQLLRYMGWVVWNRADGDRNRVKGAIVCASADDYLLFAASCIPNLQLLAYSVTGGLVRLNEVTVAGWALLKHSGVLSKDRLRNGLEGLQQDQGTADGL